MDLVLHPDRERREKILRSMANLGYLNVWEGAVRSSKTVMALAAFALYVTRSVETRFLLSGRTVKTIEKNCILEDFGILNLLGLSKDNYRKVGESRAIVFNSRCEDGVVREKQISVFGASDIRAYMAIRGNTYGGWFADEINMHDPEFVSEALRRTAVSRDRKHLWTLNPDNPFHWTYTDYLDRYDAMSPEEKRELGGYHWWHFTPHDNPVMTPEMLRSLELQYPEGSYLYDRYIKGERCMAEGLIYPEVNASHFIDFDIRDVDVRYCAIDFGTDHPTVMYFGGMFKGNRKDWRICAEYFDQGSSKTTHDHYCGFLDVCERHGWDPQRITVAIDPAAKVLRLEFMKHGIPTVKAKNDVLDGINFTRTVIHRGIQTFHSSLKGLLKQFSTYSWDPKASERGEDKPIKVEDDRADALRYFDFTHMHPVIGGTIL